MIDQLGLYNEVFTNPIDEDRSAINTARWSIAYNCLLEIVAAKTGRANEESSLTSCSTILLRNPDEVYLAWMVACFIPWAREQPKTLDKPNPKKSPSAASTAAREGIKADNKVMKIVEDAVSCLPEIIAVKDGTIKDEQSTSSPSKRKLDTVDRVSHGQALRRWGSNWRNSVLFAMLTQVAESKTEAGKSCSIACYLLRLRS